MTRDLLEEYYARRATEYERIYAKPERQEDLRALESHVARLMAGRDVLEIACGTGFWTRVIATSARSIVATDAGQEVLEIARRRQTALGQPIDEVSTSRLLGVDAPRQNPAIPAREREVQPQVASPAVAPSEGSSPGRSRSEAREASDSPTRFVRADAFRLGEIEGRFDAAFAGFWWSHVPKDRIADFLSGLHTRLEPAARVLLIDNRYAEGSSTPISRTDDRGNTYQMRRLDDGSEHEVLKNFPSPTELRAALPACAVALEILELTYFWALSYEVVA